MNNAQKYLDQCSLLSTSIKQKVKVHIESGLKKSDLNLRILQLDPFIKELYFKTTIKQDVYSQMLMAMEYANGAKDGND